jgi:hypothetical protein
MLQIADGKPLWPLEAGYPSDACGVEPGGQAAFVTAPRCATAVEGVALLSFTYLIDLREDVVDSYAACYRIGTDCFRRYLATLGLRTVDATAKPALAAIAAPFP